MKMGEFPHGTGAQQVGGFHDGTDARQGGRIPTQHRRPARWADFHTAPAPGKGGRIPTAPPAPGKVGGFPQAPAPGKVGGFPTPNTGARQGISTGARQGGRIPHWHRHDSTGPGKVGRIFGTRWAALSHRAPGKVGGFPRHRRPARWADFHNFNYTGRPRRTGARQGGFHTAPAPGKVGGFPHGTPAPGKAGGFPTQHRRPARYGFPHGTGARQGGRIPTRHRRPARRAGFPHGTGARQGGRDSPHSTGARQVGGFFTRHRRPARWRFPHSNRRPAAGRFPHRHRRPARWADSTQHRRPAVGGFYTAPAPGKVGAPAPAPGKVTTDGPRWADPIPIVQLRGRILRTRGGRAAAAWRRESPLGYGWLWLRGGVGLLLGSVPQFPAICGRCPVESGAVAFHALTGIWRHRIRRNPT